MAIQLSSSSKILWKMPDILILFENSLVGWMMKCKSIELLGHIQTIELKGFGCYIPLHFPKDIGILKLNMQPRDGPVGEELLGLMLRVIWAMLRNVHHEKAGLSQLPTIG